GMLTVVFYARLWRRAGVMTDAEFAEIRYSGPPAAFLRGFRACYLALAINSIIIGWVTAAMAKIVGMTLGVGKWQATLGLFVLTALYSTLSGLWGVLVTDFFQFVLAMLGCIALAVFALGAVGGMAAPGRGREADAVPLLRRPPPLLLSLRPAALPLRPLLFPRRARQGGPAGARVLGAGAGGGAGDPPPGPPRRDQMRPSARSA